MGLHSSKTEWTMMACSWLPGGGLRHTSFFDATPVVHGCTGIVDNPEFTNLPTSSLRPSPLA